MLRSKNKSAERLLLERRLPELDSCCDDRRSDDGGYSALLFALWMLLRILKLKETSMVMLIMVGSWKV